MEGNSRHSCGPGDAAGAALSVVQCRAQIADARTALAAVRDVLWQVPSGGGAEGLSGLIGEVDQLVVAGQAAQVAVHARGDGSG